MARSSHPFLELFFVFTGSGEFAVGPDTLQVREGDLILVPSEVPHRIQDLPGEPLSLYVLCLSESLVALAGESPQAGRITVATELQQRLRRDWRRLLFEQTRPQSGTPTLMIGRAMALLGTVLRNRQEETRAEEMKTGFEARITRYIEELEQRFFEVGDLDAECALLDISRRRFTQLFRAATGVTWHQRVTELRLRYAEHLLRHTRRSVTAIAFESGYDELSSFYRAFKRRTGRAPLEWREEGSRMGST